MSGGKNKNFHPNFAERRDKKAFWFAPKKPYFIQPSSLIKKQTDGLLMMPLPVATPFKIPCWHTMYFAFGKKLANWVLRRALRENDYFYYLMHPRDLADYTNDIPDNLKTAHHDEMSVFESLEAPILEKTDYVNEALRIIKESGRQFVTLETMASEIIKNKKI